MLSLPASVSQAAPAPLFGAFPGGPELLIILLVMLLFFGPVVVLAVLAVRYVGDDSEVRELERRIDELEAQVGDGPDAQVADEQEATRRATENDAGDRG